MLEDFNAGAYHTVGLMSLESGFGDEFSAYTKLWEDAKRELYCGCVKYSKLSFVVRLLHVKSENNLSVKAFKDVLGLIKDALPDGEMLPNLSMRPSS